jgi:hypothetical protein
MLMQMLVQMSSEGGSLESAETVGEDALLASMT